MVALADTFRTYRPVAGTAVLDFRPVDFHPFTTGIAHQSVSRPIGDIPYFDAAHPNIPARLDVSPVRPPGNDSPTVVSDAAGRPRAAYVA